MTIGTSQKTSRRVTRISMEEVWPNRTIQVVHLTMRWGLQLCSSLVLNILLKLKINYSINRILHQKINGQRTPIAQTRLKNKRLPQPPALKLPFQIQIYKSHPPWPVGKFWYMSEKFHVKIYHPIPMFIISSLLYPSARTNPRPPVPTNWALSLAPVFVQSSR